MATTVTGTGLMSNGNMRPMAPTAAIRFATWILPRHRRDWAEAMLNEVAHIGSRRAAVLWALGCMLFALKERSSYEFARALPTHAIPKALLGVSAALILTVTGVYAIQKPYQRERIRLIVFHGCRKSGCPPHSSRPVTDSWAINVGESGAHDSRTSR